MAGKTAFNPADKSIRSTVTSLVVMLVYVCCVNACRGGEHFFKEDYELLRSIKVGTSEGEVRAKLGEPLYEYPSGTPASVYCMSGRACEDRAVTGKLLIYNRGEPSGFYFLDPTGKVEYVFVGGS